MDRFDFDCFFPLLALQLRSRSPCRVCARSDRNRTFIVRPLALPLCAFDFWFLWQMVKLWPAQGPMVSPWRRCARRAFRETLIVTAGFFCDPVRWQIVTFSGYWPAAADGR